MRDGLSTSDYSFENGIKMLLGKEFGGKASGFDVVWEAKHYKTSVFDSERLKTIYGQATGAEPKIAEIYWQGAYLCDVSEAMTPDQVKDTINQSLMQKIIKSGR